MDFDEVAVLQAIGERVDRLRKGSEPAAPQRQDRGRVTRKVRELEGRREAGTTSRPGRVPTVAQWMRIYLSDIAPLRVDQRTLDSTYRPKIKRWIIPRLGKHRLDRLYPEHRYAFYASLRSEGLAPNTIVQIHRILLRALTLAVRQERISRNPCTLIDAPQPEDAEPLLEVPGEDLRGEFAILIEDDRRQNVPIGGLEPRDLLAQQQQPGITAIGRQGVEPFPGDPPAS